MNLKSKNRALRCPGNPAGESFLTKTVIAVQKNVQSS